MMDECRKHAHSEMIYGMLPVVLMGCSSRGGGRLGDGCIPTLSTCRVPARQRFNQEHAPPQPAGPCLSLLLSFVRGTEGR